MFFIDKFEMRFDKKPKIVRKLLENEEPVRINKNKSENSSKKIPNTTTNPNKATNGDNNKLPNLINSNNETPEGNNSSAFSVSGIKTSYYFV